MAHSKFYYFMIRQTTNRICIFKFTVYFSHLNIVTDLGTVVRLLWKTEHASAESTQLQFELKKGKARLDVELTLEDILILDSLENKFLPKQVTIICNLEHNCRQLYRSWSVETSSHVYARLSHTCQ